MKKIIVLIFTAVVLQNGALSQVTVTNPTNTTPNLAATYTSLANAITALDAITAISGPVTITLTAGNPETAPAGGYNIQFAATTSVLTPIIINGNNNIITASSSLTAGSTSDAIFKLVGVDYTEIENFTMKENAANTVTSPQASNNMTEFGVALFRSSTTNGAQFNVIMNNTISLNKDYTNSFGIYSNVRSTATGVLTTNDITNVSGSNYGNKVYGNNISNVNAGITFIGTNLAGAQDVGNDIGGASAATGNTITDWGSAAPISNFPSNSGTLYGIFVNNQTSENVSYNIITSAAVSGTSTTFVGIRKDYTASQPVGTVTSTISHNTITMTSSFTSGTFDGILSQGMTTLSTATININNNTIQNCVMNGAASSSTIIGIANSSAPGVLNMNDNIIRGNTSTATTGGFTGIQNTGAVVTTLNMNNNQLGGGGNSLVIFSVTTTSSIVGLSNSNGTAAENVSISDNTIDGISCPQSGTITAVNITGGTGANFTVNNNTFINTSITGVGATGSTIIGMSNNATAATLSITNSTINGHTTTTNNGNFIAIQNTAAVTSAVDISNNNIGSAAANAVTYSAATGSLIYGILNTSAGAAATVGITFNTILGISGVSNSNNTYAILSSGSPATTNITNNTIGNASRNAVTFSAPSGGAVYGIINTGGAATTNLNITNNKVDKISGVSFTNTNPGIGGIANTSSGIGGTLNLNNNAIGTTTGTFVTTTASSSSNFYAMLNNNGASTATVNMNDNTVDGFFINSTTGNLTTMALNGSNIGTALMSGNSFGSTGTLINYAAAQPTNGTFRVMDLGTGSSNATSTMTCQNNTVRNIIHSVTGVATVSCIFTNATPLTLTISGNQFINLNLNISGSAWMILDIATRASGQTLTVDNNSIVTGLTKTVSGGVVSGYYSFLGSSANGSILNITNNNFSNISVTGSSQLFGIVANTGASASNGTTATITGNTVSNLTAVSNDIIGIYVDKTAAATIANNILSNYNSNAAIYGIDLENSNGQGTIDVHDNTVNNYSSTGASGHVRGLFVNSANLPTLNVYNNSFTNYSTAGLSNFTAGIMFNGCQTANIYDNAMNNYTNAGTSSPLATGINITAGTSFNIYRNNIHTLSATGNFTPSNAVVSGIRAGAGTTGIFYNNFISDLTAPAVNFIDAIRGIDINSSTAASAYNVYYNSVYINATSTGTNFGTSGIYHLTNATATTAALNMIDNIIVNTSTANGTGVTAAYRRSDATLTNFAATADYNLLYAGTPSATKLIYYDGTNADQTLAAYQTRVLTREANSITAMPNFTSVTDLHIIIPDCNLTNKGTPVAGITTDIDATTRNVTNPDIGADEFAGYGATTNVALATSSTNGIDLVKGCDELGWTYYTDPADNSRYLFAINWDPSAVSDNTAAKAAATVRIQVDASYFTVNDNSVPYGTWTMQRYWNVDLHGVAMTGPANMRFFYSTAEKTTVDVQASNFAATYAGTLEPPTWFKTKTIAFAGDAAHMDEDGVYNSIGLVDVNAVPAATLNSVLYAQFNTVSTLSGGTYATGVGPNTPLPITLNYLQGVKQGNKNNLSWKVTCNNTPKATLTLERSIDAANFSAIYTITADAARCQQPFDYLDANPVAGKNYYRLKMTDENGKFTYSNIIVLLNEIKGFDIIAIAPNPVTTGRFKLNITSAENTKMNVVIMDMQGRVVQQQTVSMMAGYNSLDMNVVNLAAGTYNIYGTTASDRSRVMRFVKQ